MAFEIADPTVTSGPTFRSLGKRMSWEAWMTPGEALSIKRNGGEFGMGGWTARIEEARVMQIDAVLGIVKFRVSGRVNQ